MPKINDRISKILEHILQNNSSYWFPSIFENLIKAIESYGYDGYSLYSDGSSRGLFNYEDKDVNIDGKELLNMVTEAIINIEMKITKFIKDLEEVPSYETETYKRNYIQRIKNAYNKLSKVLDEIQAALSSEYSKSENYED